MKGFEKIELVSPSPNPSSSVTDQSPEITQPDRSRRGAKLGLGKLENIKNKKILSVLLAILIIFLLLIAVPSLLVYSSAKKTYAQVNTTVVALKNQDIALVEKELKNTREALSDTQSKMRLLFIVRFIPGPNIYYNDARPLIKVLPELLGEKEPKKYLVIFQNDKELRPTGGFITAYAVFTVDKGVITADSSDDIYKLDDSISGKEKAPPPILKYLPKVPLFNLRDSNLNPDFQESMDEFRKLYDKAAGAPDVDGIIALDTHALVSVMNVLGDIEVNGQTYTTKTDERCDCPQVIYELLEFAGIRVQYVREDRKSIIGDLMLAIMKKALSSSPGQYWGPLIQTGFSEIGKKHVLFSLEDENAQKGLSAINATGQIRDFEGDYFHLNEANFGGSKSNIFVDQDITQEYSVSKDGVITKTVIVNYKNPHKPSNCNLEAENSLCLNAAWRDWFRVYVPKGSKLVESTGSEVKLTSYEESGKTVYEGFLTVRPLGIAKLKLTYTLPFKLEKGSPLPYLIQKQPGTEDDEYVIKVSGQETNKFILDTDKILNLDL